MFYGEPGKDDKRRPYAFQKTWQAIRNSFGLTGLHFHDLRHEAVSRLVESGLNDQEVASISGHKSMQMLRRYTHLHAEGLVAKLDRLGDGDNGRPNRDAGIKSNTNDQAASASR